MIDNDELQIVCSQRIR